MLNTAPETLQRAKRTVQGVRCNGYLVHGEFYLTKQEAYAAAGIAKPVRKDKLPVSAGNCIAVADAVLREPGLLLSWAYSDTFTNTHYREFNLYLDGRRAGYAGLKTKSRAGTVLNCVEDATAFWKQLKPREDAKYRDRAYKNPTWCDDREWVEQEPLDAAALAIDAYMDAVQAEWAQQNQEYIQSLKAPVLSKDARVLIHRGTEVTEYVPEADTNTDTVTKPKRRWTQRELYKWVKQHNLC